MEDYNGMSMTCRGKYSQMEDKKEEGKREIYQV
nr:MAG TPA: hypothetical protein [Bacteriophage sp.]